MHAHATSNTAKKGTEHILISQVICFFIPVPKLLSFWYGYEKTDHLWNQNMIASFFFLLCNITPFKFMFLIRS